MSEPFAPDHLGERIVSLSAEIQRERLHIISLMTRLPGNSFGPLALLNVYAGGTDTVTRVPVERFDIDLYYITDKHEALGMGLSYTCHGAFSTENEVYHFDNVFFKIGEDEARLVSPSQRVLLETGYEALQRSGLIRASVGIAFQAEHSSIPSSPYQPFDEYKLPPVAPLQLKGCTRTPSLSSTTTPSGASERRHCLCFVLSTSTSGSSRRVPPLRGSRLAPLLQGLPFSVF